MAYRLRDYQIQAKKDIRQAYGDGHLHVILQSPTGTGKTVMFTDIAREVVSKGKKVLICTHRTELLLQSGGSCERSGLEPFYIEAGQKVISNAFSTYVAMAQTLRRRIGEFPRKRIAALKTAIKKHPEHANEWSRRIKELEESIKLWEGWINTIDLIIIDECHTQDFNFLFESGLIDNIYVIGASATPQRSGKQRQLGLDYTKIISTISVQECINRGYLVPDDYFAPMSADMEGVAVDRSKGDYQLNQMFNRFDSPRLYSGAVEAITEHAPDAKTIVFCVNIEHTIKTTLEFAKAGYKVRYLTSKLSKPKPPKEGATEGQKVIYEERLRVYELQQQTWQQYSGERKEIMDGYKSGEFQILVNADIATTGVDVPSIESVVLLRATMSKTLLYQMLGRGSRICPEIGKASFNVFDFGTNCERLGYYTEDQLWGLWHEEGKGGGLAPIKYCGYDKDGQQIRAGGRIAEGCRRPIHGGFTICPFCGFKYPKQDPTLVDLSTIMYNPDTNMVERRKPISKMSNEELIAYQKEKGHKEAWLWARLYARGGEKLVEEIGVQQRWGAGKIHIAKKIGKKISKK